MSMINISIKCILVYYSSLFYLCILYMENAFKTIHRKNKWGGGSGTGSKMSRNNKKYISILEDIIKDNNIHTICDVGCGDWEFSQYIDFAGKEYLGIDCVPDIIQTNQERFSKDNVTFQHKVIGNDYIPKGYDLIIIKDVIQHWSDEDIISYFEEILKNNAYVFCTNGFKFMRDPTKNALTTRDVNNEYRYHPVDIQKYPLNLFQKYCISTQEYHAKQMILFKF